MKRFTKKVKQGNVRCDSSDKTFKFKVFALGIEVFMSMEQIKFSFIVDQLKILYCCWFLMKMKSWSQNQNFTF